MATSTIVGVSCSSAWSQQWQPTRPHETAIQQAVNQLDQQPRPVLSSTEQVGTAMTLRWRTTAPRGALNGSAGQSHPVAPGNSAAPTSSQWQPVPAPNSHPNAGSPVQVTSGNRLVNAEINQSIDSGFDNPLRVAAAARSFAGNAVQPAAYNQQWNGEPTEAPKWRTANSRQTEEATPELGQPGRVPSIPGSQLPGNLPDFGNLPATPPSDSSGLDFGNLPQTPPDADPLDNAEAAPLPPAAETPAEQPPAFPPQVKEEKSPVDRERIDLPEPESVPQRDKNDNDKDELDDLLKKARRSSIPSCETQRDALRGQPLSTLNLDVAPKLADGLEKLQSEERSQKLRSDFETRALRRDWTDFKGNLIAHGQMLELTSGNVVVNDNGLNREIPLSELSDVDMSYIADVWNLPFRCGAGYEPLVGRDFIASTVQWKASGACHNPLYFEQVQLERYGHERGPLLQPLVSSAHFFLSIPLLPYKMGINPPNECQYALGYYRPGNCAPYMVPAFPLSLRGAAVQTGAVAGVAALFPH